MEGVALVSGAFDRGIDEAQIEERVVSDQDGALAGACLDRRADRLKHVVEGLLFRAGPGETGDRDRCR